MDGITLTAATVRGVRTSIRRTGTTQVTIASDGQFQGTDKDGKVRVAGTVDGETGAVNYSTKPKKLAKKS
jgi:hypothetical protein